MRLPWIPTVYVRLRPDSIYLKDVRSGTTLLEQPLAAISQGSPAKLLAVGDAAAQANDAGDVKLFNPFKHPRSLISDFTVANQIIKRLVRKLVGRRLFLPGPFIVLHPDVTMDGGITQIEVRALRELALGAGASRAIVWEGRELTDGELLNRSFTGGGRVLE